MVDNVHLYVLNTTVSLTANKAKLAIILLPADSCERKGNPQKCGESYQPSQSVWRSLALQKLALHSCCMFQAWLAGTLVRPAEAVQPCLVHAESRTPAK